MAVRLTGIASGLDTDSIVQELVSAYSYKVEKYEKQKTKLEWTKGAWKDMNKDIYKFYTSQLGTMRYQSAYKVTSTSLTDSSVATVTASGSAPKGTQNLDVQKLAQTAYLTSGKLTLSDNSGGKVTKDTTLGDLGYRGSDSTTLNVTDKDGNNTTIDINSNTTISEVLSQLQNAGLTATFDSDNQRIFIGSKTMGAAGEFNITTTNTEDSSSALTALKLDTGSSVTEEVNRAGKVTGQDAIIVLNGATFTSSDNTVTANGLTIKATSEGKTNITVQTDAQAVYDKIKNFLSEYNTLMTSMQEKYNADSAKDYEPLTDEEKDAMTDTEIEKWEQKIKDSLLRNDSTLGSVANSLISAMSQSFYIKDGVAITYDSTNKVYKAGSTILKDGDGNAITTAEAMKAQATKSGYKSYSLSSFGITTGGYYAEENEGYNYHIDGDSDDSLTGTNKDKLLKAIQEEPDNVMAFFAALNTKTYQSLGTRMSTSTLSSAMTVYNDKVMDKEIDELESDIDDWQERLEELEDQWYEKFSAMETALAELQAKQTQLGNLLGTA